MSLGFARCSYAYECLRTFLCGTFAYAEQFILLFELMVCLKKPRELKSGLMALLLERYKFHLGLIKH